MIQESDPSIPNLGLNPSNHDTAPQKENRWNKSVALQAEFSESLDKSESFGFDFLPSSGGQTLQETVLTKMQMSFGHNFSNVRIHQDGQADKLGAHAFTVGDDIHFSRSSYNMDNNEGQKLLGHELTHVIQQRENRVHAPESNGSATVFQDKSLEQEADRFGSSAAAGLSVGAKPGEVTNPSGNVIQQKPVLQPVLPAIATAFSAVSGWAAVEANATAVATLATIAGAAGSAGAAVGSAISPGNTGVQEVQIQPWISDVDKHKLEFLIQSNLINAYVDAWVSAHPEVNLSEEYRENVTTTTANTNTLSSQTPNAPSGISETATNTHTVSSTTRDASPNADGSSIDTAIANSVKSEVQIRIETLINEHQKTAPASEFIWSDSGESTADWIGTVGAIKFSQVMGSFITQSILLSENAKKIRGLRLPMQGESLTIKIFRGGRMHQGPSMSAGYGDDLAINLMGGAPTLDQAEPSMIFATSWKWDDSTTSMNIKIKISANGMPEIAEIGRDGSPDDFTLL